MRATNKGSGLQNMENCYISVPNVPGGTQKIFMNNLPTITDSKSAEYTDEQIPGRSTPIKTYNSSSPRAIGWTIHLFTNSETDAVQNIKTLKLIQSLTYPREGNISAQPFLPPIICQLKCGALLASISTGNTLAALPVCAVLKSYSVSFPQDVSWHNEFYTPDKFDIVTNWEVVYASSKLPGQENILKYGV